MSQQPGTFERVRNYRHPSLSSGRNISSVRQGIRVGGIIVGLMVLACSMAFALTPSASAFTGVYAYNPQMTQPSRLLIKAPPEQALRARLRQQITKDHTYPKDAGVAIVQAEPVWVEVDLQHGGTASVTMKLTYENGTERLETFSVPSVKQSGLNLPLVPYTAFAIEYGWLGECVPTAPNQSYCPLNL